MDIIGLFPVYGEAADLLNALISAFRGKWGDAGLSLFAIIPVVGMAGTLGKWGKKGYKVFDKVVTTGAKSADEAADICKAKDGAKVTENLGGAFEQAVKNTFRKKIIRENEIMYDGAGKPLTETDFETVEALVEVGISAEKKLEQLHIQAEIAKQGGKRLDVIYGPDTKPRRVDNYKKGSTQNVWQPGAIHLSPC